MSIMRLNHWFIGGNELSISLMRFYVRIEICQNDSFIYYRLEVYDNGKPYLIFNFYSLEDAVSFTENEISKCETYDDILARYKDLFANNRFQPLSKALKRFKD